MNDKIFADVAEKAKAAFEPAKKLGALGVANAEELTKLQVGTLDSLSKLGIARMKAATQVSDVADLQAFVAGQAEFFKAVGEKLSTDAKAIAKLSEKYAAEAQKIAKESVEAYVPKAN